MSRALIAVVSVGAVAALVGCRGTADTDATATQQQLPPRDAARAILAEVDQFNRDFADVPDQASRIVLQQREGCDGVPAGLGQELEARVKPAELFFAEAIMVELSHRDFSRFARRLQEIKTDDVQLQKLISNAAIAADEAVQAEGHHFDWCATLTAWRRSGWSDEVENAIYAEPFRTTGMNREKLERLRAENVDVMPRLQQLGLSLTEAARITAALGPI